MNITHYLVSLLIGSISIWAVFQSEHLAFKNSKVNHFEYFDSRANDSLALVELYEATSGEDWTVKWDLSLPVDTWHGVFLNEEGCVTCIDLDGNPICDNITGGGNNLFGALPDLNLPFLELLYLGENDLSLGPIPDFSGLPNLTILNLPGCGLSGSIPDFTSIPKLQKLDLRFNELNGSIPDFSNLPNLQVLDIANNQLTGNIPNFSSLNSLNQFFASDNQLEGFLPEFTNVLELIQLDVSSNQLSGSIPNFSNQFSLFWLILDGNQFSGTLPELNNQNNLEILSASGNQLSGCFPQGYRRFCSIEYNFEDNPGLPWNGDMNIWCAGEEDAQKGAPCDDGDPNTDEDFITPLCVCKGIEIDAEECRLNDSLELVKLYNSTNGPNWTITWNLEAPMENWFGVQLEENGCVSCLDLDGLFDCHAENSNGNNLTGTLVPLNLPKLVFLDLSNNQITGNIPSEFGNLSELRVLELSSNNLSGNIPADLSALEFLSVLSLGFNQLEGKIPDEVGNLTNLTDLYLENNQLMGNIPSTFGNLIHLVEMDLETNLLDGNIPNELENMEDLKILDLSDNQLQGDIPIKLGNLISLEGLFIGLNKLSGELPPELANLINLKRLFLDNNQLTGCFPVSYEQFCTQLESFDFTSNPKLPWQGNFENFCDGIPQIQADCDDCDPNTENDIINDECSCKGTEIEAPCTALNVPIIPNTELTYCSSEPIPVLSAEVDIDETVNWYESPDSALPIFTGSDFQPSAPGIYYAEAVLKEDSSCTSDQRTSASIRERKTPIIGLNRQVDCFENYYVLSLTILNIQTISSNADSIFQNGNVYTLLYTNLNQSSSIEVRNGDCVRSLNLPPPNCGCAEASLSPPIAEIEVVNFCPSELDNLPSLEAFVPPGLTVRWYNTAVAGEPIAINTSTYQPEAPGTYYAETFDPNQNCRSNERTTFFVLPSVTPFIAEYDRFCQADGIHYTVILTIDGEDEILNSAGNLSRGFNNRDTISNIPLGQNSSIIAVNQNTGCQTEFITQSPDCGCFLTDIPMTDLNRLTYCVGDPIPQLVAIPPPGMAINWYDAPDNGNLLLANSNTLSPDGPGVYYVEIFNPADNCISTNRIGIELNRLELDVSIFDRTTCDIFELGADTLTYTNSLGCDSLVITNTYLEELVVTRGEEHVCLLEETGFDTLLVSGDSDCFEVRIVERLVPNYSNVLNLGDDNYQLQPNERINFVDLTENDIFPEGYLFDNLDLPEVGNLEFEVIDGQKTGKINFTAPSNPQNVDFQYIVCDNNCPEMQCDTATVVFNIDCAADLEGAFFELFTPNGDGKNDFFDPLAAFFEAGCPIDENQISFTIANRFGEVVFVVEDTYQSWDGNNLKGQSLPNGTYFFVLKIENEEKVYKGFIDLVR